MCKNTPIPWKLRTGPEPGSGALNIEQIRKIGAEYEFEDDHLLPLSQKIAMVQSKTFKLQEPELFEPKRERGAKEAEKVIEDLQKAHRALSKARGKIDRMRFLSPFGLSIVPNPAVEHLADLTSAGEAIENFQGFLNAMRLERCVVYSEQPDRRKVRDLRRRLVCWTIFGFWEEHGRKLSYTTNDVRKERGGKLFDFINAIVACMTEPQARISGETLKLELASYSAFCAEHRQG